MDKIDTIKWPADNPVRKTVASLIPYARNSRTHSPEQVTQISASIKELGFTNPILIDGEGGIIAGHGRMLAAKKLGLDEVPCLIADGWTDAMKRAYVIADNKLALNAGWDNAMLAVEFAALGEAGFNLDLTGFGTDEIAGLLTPDVVQGLTDEDAVPEAPEVPISVLGDVWVLGNHRLMCGDSTSIDAVDKLMAGVKADMVWTDPPYGVSYVGKTSDALTIENDSLDDAELEDFLRAAFNCLMTASRAGASWYVAAPSGPLHHCFSTVLKELGVWRQTLNWVKQTFVMGRSDYHYRHEPIFYGWKPGAGHYFINDRKQDTILEFNKPTRNGEHPTMKPVELIERCVANSSKTSQIILDLFGGSGSTLIACEKTARACRMMELDNHYTDVIIKRWEQFTGKQAIHADTGVPFGNASARTDARVA